MPPEEISEAHDAARSNPFTAADVAAILLEHGWRAGECSEAQQAWCERAAAMLGRHPAERAGLAELLGLIFHYDARELLNQVENHAVLARYGAREVIRELALLLLDGQSLDSDRLKTVITALKDGLQLRGRDLFYPLRLALAGRIGEGELDRVILLLDSGAAAGFAGTIKRASERILEFCAALD